VIARSPDEARGLAARGLFDAGRNLVVDPYLVEMREVAGALLPLRQRERVRLDGPSILDDVPGYTAPPARPPDTDTRGAEENAAGQAGSGRGEALPRAEAA
jgi:hypothetical protein